MKNIREVSRKGVTLNESQNYKNTFQSSAGRMVLTKIRLKRACYTLHPKSEKLRKKY